MKTLLVILTALALSACATCREHPVACTIGTAVIVGSVAATVALHSDNHSRIAPRTSSPQPVNCGDGSACQ